MNWWKSPRTFPIRIFLVAIILRLVPVILTRSMGIGLDDMFQYDMLARSIVAGNGYRWYAQADLPLIQSVIHLDLTSTNYDPRGVLTSFRPPLYPAFLALIYFFSGVGVQRFFVVRLVQTALAASLAPLTFSMARWLLPERSRAAVIAAWIIALYPTLIIYPLALATENLFFVLLLGSALVLLVASKKLTWQWFALAGILLGMMTLTRSVSLAIAGLAVIWVWFVLHKRKMAMVVLGIFSLVAVPWMIRNTLLHQQISGIETNLGYNLYIGYHPDGTGTFQYPQSLTLLPILDDARRDTIGRQMAQTFIQADPDRLPYLLLRRAGYFFGLERRALTYFYSNNYFGYIPPMVLLIGASIFCLPFIFVLSTGTFGLVFTHCRKETLLMGLFLIGYITPHLLILSEERFHLALVPFFAILAANSWTSLSMLKERWQAVSGRNIILMATLAVLSLLINWGLELWRDAGKLASLLGPNGNLTFFPY